MAALTTTALLALTAANAANQYAGQRRAANAAETQGNYARAAGELNAQFSERQATDALARGQEAANRQRTATNQFVGRQRAALGAQGLALDVGSAVDVQGEARVLGELDRVTILNNAAREAYGFRSQATIQRFGGEMGYQAGKNEAAAYRMASYGTLLSGAADIYDVYRTRPKPKGK